MMVEQRSLFRCGICERLSPYDERTLVTFSSGGVFRLCLPKGWVTHVVMRVDELAILGKAKDLHDREALSFVCPECTIKGKTP